MGVKSTLAGTIAGSVVGAGMGGKKGLQTGIGIGVKIGFIAGIVAGIAGTAVYMLGKEKVEELEVFDGEEFLDTIDVALDSVE